MKKEKSLSDKELVQKAVKSGEWDFIIYEKDKKGKWAKFGLVKPPKK